MSFRQQNVAQMNCSNGFRLLVHVGSRSHTQMDRTTTTRYLDYDLRSKEQETRQADTQDKSDQNTLETTLKKRPKP